MKMMNISMIRIIRIALGIFFLFSAYGERSWGIGILGSVLLIQGVLNVGCGFGAKSCGPANGSKYNTDFNPDKSFRRLKL